jgi:hypothetical protein
MEAFAVLFPMAIGLLLIVAFVALAWPPKDR